MREKQSCAMIVTIVIGLLSYGTAGANIPAPPTNQTIGLYDTVFNNLTEAECRVCHDDPGIGSPTSNVDRHHLLYSQALREGECSVNRNACLSDANCNAGICHPQGHRLLLTVIAHDAGVGETCGEVCIGETVAPVLDTDQDGVDDTNYSCLVVTPMLM